jgi:hypothetical protein
MGGGESIRWSQRQCAVGDCIVTRMIGQGKQTRRWNGTDDTIGIGKGWLIIKGEVTACHCNAADTGRLNGNRDGLLCTLEGDLRKGTIQRCHVMAQKLMRFLMMSARFLNSKDDELDIRIGCDELSVVGGMLLSSTVDG